MTRKTTFKFLDKYSDTEYGKSNLQGVIETNTHDGYEGIPTDIEYEAEKPNTQICSSENE